MVKITRSLTTKPPVWVNGFIERGEEYMNSFVDEKVASTVGSFLVADPESGKNLVDVLAERFGRGFRMSLLAGKSANKRHDNMIESRVFDAAKAKIPELQLGVAALEQFGLGDLATPENLPALLGMAQKYGLMDGLIGSKTSNNGGGGGESW